MAYNTVPTHADPASYTIGDITYNFDNWTPAPVAVTGEATYEATYTMESSKVFPGHSITLNGDVNVNYFVAPEAIKAMGYTDAQISTAVVSFDWGDGKEQAALTSFPTDENGWYKTMCEVPAANMAHQITAKVTIGDTVIDTDVYSVQSYAETIINDANQPEKLKTLMKEMLNYGAMAQIVFDNQITVSPKPELANKNIVDAGYVMKDVTVAMIQAAIDAAPANQGKTVSDMDAAAAQFGAKYYASSVVFLSKSTLRHYFTKADDTFDPSKFDGNQSNFYYFVQKENIPAAELDNLVEFKVGEVKFYYSPLDYAKAIVGSSAPDSAKNLVKAMYLYNDAANAYFG